MEKTTNFNLNKPEVTDPLRVEDFNENANIIDGLLKNLSAERIHVGSYTGDDTAERFIPLPFTPKAVLLFVRFNSNPIYYQMYVLTNQFHFIISDEAIKFTTATPCALLESGLRVGGVATNYANAENYYIAIR